MNETQDDNEGDGKSSKLPSEKKLTYEVAGSRELLQSVFDTSLIQMSVLKAVRDPQGNIQDFRIILVNQELEKETGRTDLVGKLYAEEYPGIRQTELFKTMLQVMNTGNSGKLEYLYAHDGLNKWYSSMFVRMDDGLVATNLDITERKAAEAKALKNLTLLEKTEELARSGSWDYDVATRDFWWSEGMYRLFEIPKDTLVSPGLYLDYVVSEDRHLAEELVKSITETFEGIELTIRLRINNTVKIIKIRSLATYDDQHEIEKVLGIDIDITAVVHTQELMAIQNVKLSQSQELLRKKDEFISIASHELKTPVTSIKAYTEILEHQFLTSDDMETASFLEKMNAQVDRLTHLIKNLLDTTNLSDGEIKLFKEQFDMHSLLKERIEELQRLSRNHTIVFRSAGAALVVADKERISQVLTNLIMNAQKYSPQGGMITVSLSRMEESVQVSVEDQGIGIKREMLDKIFERFYRIDTSSTQTFPGLGLGLYISAGIISRHGGKISVASEEGKGSLFTFNLPALHQ